MILNRKITGIFTAAAMVLTLNRPVLAQEQAPAAAPSVTADPQKWTKDQRQQQQDFAFYSALLNGSEPSGRIRKPAPLPDDPDAPKLTVTTTIRLTDADKIPGGNISLPDDNKNAGPFLEFRRLPDGSVLTVEPEEGISTLRETVTDPDGSMHEKITNLSANMRIEKTISRQGNGGIRMFERHPILSPEPLSPELENVLRNNAETDELYNPDGFMTRSEYRDVTNDTFIMITNYRRGIKSSENTTYRSESETTSSNTNSTDNYDETGRFTDSKEHADRRFDTSTSTEDKGKTCNADSICLSWSNEVRTDVNEAGKTSVSTTYSEIFYDSSGNLISGTVRENSENKSSVENTERIDKNKHIDKVISHTITPGKTIDEERIEQTSNNSFTNEIISGERTVREATGKLTFFKFAKGQWVDTTPGFTPPAPRSP